MDKLRGFEEVEHTADWALRVWAPDLPGLLVQAAEGMYALMGVKFDRPEAEERAFEVKGMDAESLLVAFLGELLLLGEEERVGLLQMAIQLNGFEGRVQGHAAPIIQQDKEIKAVTFHNLDVKRTARGFEATVVFDV